MILVQLWVFPDGERPRMVNTDFLKFENNHEFGFDTSNNKNWLNFLSKYKLPNKKPLPRKTPNGLDIRYRVYVLGSHPIYKHLQTLFPGFDKDGVKLSLKQYGGLL